MRRAVNRASATYSLAAIALLGSLAMPRVAHACAVCAASDPTLDAPGAEQPYVKRLRVGVDALAGRVSEAAADGRRLSIDDVRIALTASYAISRDVMVSLVLPTLDRSLQDARTRTSTFVLGDVDARIYDLVWRANGATRRTLGLFAGAKAPTAPIERDSLGAPLPVELEPGCGSIVPYVGAAYAIGRGRFSGRASVAVYLPFSVRDQPHPGDSLRTTAWFQVQGTQTLATRFGVSTRLDSTGELAPGVADLNSGGFVGYVTSDVIVSPATDVVLSVGASFPVVQAWLGVHRETAIAGVHAAYDF